MSSARARPAIPPAHTARALPAIPPAHTARALPAIPPAHTARALPAIPPAHTARALPAATGGAPRALARLAAAALLAVLAIAGPAAPATAAPAKSCGPVVSDPLAEEPWALTRLRPDLAWPLSTGAGVTVAVIDSGVSPDHRMLAGKVRPGIDYVAPGGDGTCDENGHGTLIAGIIAGRAETSAGFRFYGVAPGAVIVPVRVLRDQQRAFGSELSARVATAIRYAVDEAHANVINMSLTTESTPDLVAAVEHAHDRGVVLVAAAGNGGASEGAQYPAAYPDVIAVGGVDTGDKHVDSSSTGAYVDIAAPGDRISGPSPRGGGYLYTTEGGTSFAAGYVTGVVALVRAYDRTLTPDQIAQRIEQTADHPAGLHNDEVGYGVVNPARAVGALRVAGAAGVPAGTRLPAAQRAAGDPPRGVTGTAVRITAAGVLVTLLLLIAVPVVRGGRARRWRAGGT
jgi:membrane-anchored mycosin MYCP